jgi:hypothetical protein
MSSKLLHDVRRFLMALEKVQEELGELFTHKRQALLHADTEAMARLTEAEAKTGERMQALLRFRAQLLNAAHGEGHAAESLADLIPRIAGAETDVLMQQVARGEANAGQLRHESWVLWIISHRCYNHYTEVLELIAHGGERSPVYSDRPETVTRGGAVLDAAV